MAKKKKKEVPEEAILFPEIEVDGIKVKPWSLGQLADLAPTLDGVFATLEKLDVNLDNLTFSSLMKLQFSITPYLPKILSVTLSISEEEVREFDIGKTTRILGAIWTQNQENLGNALSLFGATLPELPEETGEKTE